MMKHNDPRFWGKVAAKGGIKGGCVCVSKTALARTINEYDRRMVNGATVTRDPATNRFRALRTVRAELIHKLGRSVMETT